MRTITLYFISFFLDLPLDLFSTARSSWLTQKTHVFIRPGLRHLRRKRAFSSSFLIRSDKKTNQVSFLFVAHIPVYSFNCLHCTSIPITKEANGSVENIARDLDRQQTSLQTLRTQSKTLWPAEWDDLRWMVILHINRTAVRLIIDCRTLPIELELRPMLRLTKRASHQGRKGGLSWSFCGRLFAFVIVCLFICLLFVGVGVFQRSASRGWKKSPTELLLSVLSVCVCVWVALWGVCDVGEE